MLRKSTNGYGQTFWTLYVPEENAEGGLEITLRATKDGLDYAGNLITWADIDRAKAGATGQRVTDWSALDALTDEDIERAVADDPDAAPILTAADIAQMKPARRPARERLHFMIVENFIGGTAARPISDADTLAGDLGLDSLDLVELVMLAEEEFGVDFDPEEDDQFVALKTFGEAVAFLERKLAECRKEAAR